MTDESALARVRAAGDVPALKVALQAGLNAAYHRFRSEMWALNTGSGMLTPPDDEYRMREAEIREAWEESRRRLQAAFAERLWQIEGGG